MLDYKIKFINHSCISFENEKHLMLVDPWFFSKVFNNSWSLLEDTDVNKIDFSKLTHIFYTHEHPDHLNWPTLKLISERANNKVWIIGLKKKIKISKNK